MPPIFGGIRFLNLLFELSYFSLSILVPSIKPHTFVGIPTNVCGFIEGTRIDKEKYDNSKSKFKNLMPPKIGGMGYTLEVMPYIDTLTDITLIYKSSKRTFWDFLCGDMNEATVLILSLIHI